MNDQRLISLSMDARAIDALWCLAAAGLLPDHPERLEPVTATAADILARIEEAARGEPVLVADVEPEPEIEATP